MSSQTRLIGEVCLYGTHKVGAGWLARPHGGAILGDGEPKAGRSFTAAIFEACKALTDAGCGDGRVTVYDAGGQRQAEVDLLRPGYYGGLKWQPAKVYEISAEAIERAAGR